MAPHCSLYFSSAAGVAPSREMFTEPCSYLQRSLGTRHWYGSGVQPTLCAACRRLSLYANEIGDEGTIALARALDAGALQNMSALLLNSNRVGDSGIVALAVAMRRGALPHLERLCLSSNAIGDHGVAELADSAACDALRTLEYLVLERNRIGHTGSVTHAISFEGNVDS